MKKIILPALAILAFGTISNAQLAQKQPVKHAAVVATKPSMTNTTPAPAKPAAAQSGIKKKKTTTPTQKAVIKRKHHHQARKPKTKKH